MPYIAALALQPWNHRPDSVEVAHGQIELTTRARATTHQKLSSVLTRSKSALSSLTCQRPFYEVTAELLHLGRVENRRSGGNLPVAIWRRFRWPPQSGLAWLCFLFPLIEPDMRSYRIRCCRQHLKRNVAKLKMWLRGFKRLAVNTPVLDIAT